MARKTKKADPSQWAEQHDKARAMADAMISPSEDDSRWTATARRIITAHFLWMQQEGGLVVEDPKTEGLEYARKRRNNQTPMMLDPSPKRQAQPRKRPA